MALRSILSTPSKITLPRPQSHSRPSTPRYTVNWSATAVASGGVDEIKPLSQEEAFARQDEIRQLGWFTPNWEDAAIDAIRVAERYWRKYYDVVGADYKEYLLQGDEAVYMAFIDWIAAMARQKGQQKSWQTYMTYWKWLSEYHALHSQKKGDSNVLQQMRRFLNPRFRADHMVSVCQKEKHTLSAEDLGILMRQNWLYGQRLWVMASRQLCWGLFGPVVPVVGMTTIWLVVGVRIGNGNYRKGKPAKELRRH